MTKSKLINILSDRFSQLVHKDAELSVKAILDSMAESLIKRDRIEIRGFGSFSLNYRPSRVGRNGGRRSASRPKEEMSGWVPLTRRRKQASCLPEPATSIQWRSETIRI